MADTTSRRGLPYPEGSDAVAVPADVQALAEALDDIAKDSPQDVVANIPGSGSAGDFFYATDEELLYRHNGTSWKVIGPVPLADGDVTTSIIASKAVTDAKLANDESDDANRAVGSDHIKSGAVDASKIADALKPSEGAEPGTEALRAVGSTADTVVAGNDSRLTPGNANEATVRELGSSSNQAAPGNDVRFLGVLGGDRAPVRTASRVNVNLAAVPSTINGVTMANNDRVLLAGQTDPIENGIYVWNTGPTLTRATDMAASSSVFRGTAVVAVTGVAGVDTGSTWMLNNSAQSSTVGTHGLTWAMMGYRGYGTSSTRPAATQVMPGGTFFNTFTGSTSYSTGSTWTTIEILPPGTMLPYPAGTSAPEFFLLANGQAVSRATHARIFDLFGTTYGAGNGTTTFNLPDGRGRAFIGLDTMGTTAADRVAAATTLGWTGGAETHALTTAQLAAHTHTGTTSTSGSHSHSGTTGAAGGHSHVTFGGGVSGRRAVLTAADHPGHSGVGTYVQATGSTTGATSYDPTTNSVSGHAHSFSTSTDGGHTHWYTTGSSGNHSHSFTTASSGSGDAHNNLQPSMAGSWIIKI